jgi:hypothetical protein
MIKESVFVFDWAKVNPEVIEGLNNGTIWLRDGVAVGSDGVKQWLPIIEKTIDSSENIETVLKQLQSAQTLQLAATALSTGLILGAIVVQTMYLAKKIDKLQQQIDLVSQDVHSQNVLYFMGQLSEYFGLVESARILLLDKDLVEESRAIAEQYMAQLAAKRNELLSLIDNLVSYVDSASERHASLMLDFVNMMFDLLPKSIHLEVQLYERYGKSKLADHIAATAKQRYEQVLANYKMWCNNKARGVLNGSGTEHAKLFHEKESLLKQLFNSEINQTLLKVHEIKVLAPVCA